MNKIPRQFINDLLNRIDIFDIIDKRVKLKKAGTNYVAKCPFHTEKSPSFSVSQTKQFYHCFGCNAHGNAIGFLMAFDKMEFLDAVETLASMVGIEVPRETSATKQQDFVDVYTITHKVKIYYQQQLNKNPKAQAYLKNRGLSEKIIQDFELGYAPQGWDNLQKKAGNNSTIQQQLLTAGLTIQKSADSSYDRFRDRIIFPIHDLRGRIIGFGGRTMGNEMPKYLNSPETPIFHKGNELYGLYQARKSNRTLEKVIIVEGYMDVIALAEYGINYAVGTLGTATTSKHMQRLFRYTNDIIFCFDGDQAGQQAAWRALEIILPLMRDGLQTRFMFLPNGEDPDSLIRKEKQEGFLKRMSGTSSLTDFFFKKLSEGIDLSSVAGKARLAQVASELLKKMPRGIFQQLMFEQLANLVQINVDQLTALHLGESTTVEPTNKKIKSKAAKTTTLSPIRTALALLLQNPTLAETISDPEILKFIHTKGVDLLYQMLLILKQQPNLNTGALLEYWRDDKLGSQLAKLASWEFFIPDEGIKEEFLGALRCILQQELEKIIQELLTKATQGKITPEEKQKLQILIKQKSILAA